MTADWLQLHLSFSDTEASGPGSVQWSRRCRRAAESGHQNIGATGTGYFRPERLSAVRTVTQKTKYRITEGQRVSSLDWAPLKAIIEQNESFLISSHVRPDADALGSELGMAAILKALGRTVSIVNATAAPANLKFLMADGSIQKLGDDIRREDLPEVDVHVIVDTSAWQQLGAMADVIQKAGRKRVVIDHHVSSDNMGATEFKDVSAASTGELIFEAAEFLGITFDEATATAVYAAVATDTGWFRFPSTASSTMRVAASLMDLGAQPHHIYNQLYEQKSHARVLLAGRVLGRARISCEGRLAWIFADRNDFRETGAVPSDTESLVNECLRICGTEAAFIAVETPSGHVKISFRCRSPHDVAATAEVFGGGGHKLASGATIDGPVEDAITRVCSAMEKMLGNSTDERTADNTA